MPSTFRDQIKMAGVNGKVKMVSLPQDKNKIILRLENLDDLYDNLEYPQPALVNLGKLIEAFSPSKSYDFKEMSLTGNMELQEMLDRKIKWKTVDDSEQ